MSAALKKAPDPPRIIELMCRVSYAGAVRPDLRAGQVVFLALHSMSPDVAAEVKGSIADPSRHDERIKDFWKYIRARWAV